MLGLGRHKKSLPRLDAFVLFGITVRNIPLDGTPEDHVLKVRSWATATWEAWSEHHVFIRRWAETVFGSTRG